MAAFGASSVRARPDRAGIWVLVALAWFATFGLRPLLEPDEGRYAEIPREMWVSGDWVTPRLDGMKYFEKPPLQYWATATLYSLFGVHEWTSRFWSCALAFLCIPLVYVFARQLYGSESAGAAAAAALALNPYFLMIGQVTLLDSALCFFLTAAMFAYLRARDLQAQSSSERRWMIVCALSLALAVLSKGPVAVVLAGAAWTAHAAITREVRPWRRWHLPFTVPVFLLVAVPWFVAVSRRNPEFAEFFFIHEHLARYTTNEADRVGAWWYFLQFLLLAVLPWIAYAWPAVRSVVRGGARNPRNSAPLFLLVWSGVVLLFFSVSHSKLPPYIMPIMPAIAVLLAPHIASHPRAVRTGAWIAAGFIALVAVGLVVSAHHRSASVPPSVFVWSVVALTAATLAALYASRGWPVAMLGSILGVQALMMSYSASPPLRTAKPLVARIRSLVGPETRLFSVDQYRQSVPPYLGRPLRMALYRGELDFGMQQEPAKYIPTLDAFVDEWTRSNDALAFVSPPVVDELRARGVPFQVRAADDRTTVVSRR